MLEFLAAQFIQTSGLSITSRIQSHSLIKRASNFHISTYYTHTLFPDEYRLQTFVFRLQNVHSITVKEFGSINRGVDCTTRTEEIKQVVNEVLFHIIDRTLRKTVCEWNKRTRFV